MLLAFADTVVLVVELVIIVLIVASADGLSRHQLGGAWGACSLTLRCHLDIVALALLCLELLVVADAEVLESPS